MILKNKHYVYVALGVATVLGSCKTDSKTETSEKELTSGVSKEYMDTSVKPGDNFNSYVNGGWKKTAEIPADKSSFGAFNMLADASEDNVKAIIEESASGDFAKGSDEQKVGDLYQSYMDLETRNKTGVAPLKEEFAKIDALQNYDDLATYFAYANKYGQNVPLGLFVNQDFKDPTIYTVYIWQGGLGLPDREYYSKEDDRSKEIRAKYLEHIEKMFALAGAGMKEKNVASKIMNLETAIAKQHLPKEKTRDLVNLYNMFSIDTLSNIMPNFNWKNYLEEAGLGEQKKLGVLMLDYSKALDGIITSTDMDTWKTYLKWGVINANSSSLNEDLNQQDWEFFSKELRGTKEQRSLWRRGVSTVNSTLGEVVGKVYVKRHFPPEAKERMEILVQNLLKAYEVSIKDLDWMSDATKKEALDKLSKFTPKIGYPDKWKSYDLDLKPDDLYGNLRKSSIMEYNRELAKLGQPIDKSVWGMTPQTVNAYYNPTLNEIVFPAAILQPPFFNLEADDAVNYGAIGAVIGHEIGHGFDDTGSTFDGTGAMRNWWKEEDLTEFKKRTAALIEQYNGYEVLPNVHVNGEFTLGENIGDLGGLSIGLRAYKMSLGDKEAPVMDGFTGEQRVFLGYGQVWRKISRDEALRIQVSTDPHSPATYRVNGIVRNVPEFYNAFKVQETDSLYLAPESRVKIW